MMRRLAAPAMYGIALISACAALSARAQEVDTPGINFVPGTYKDAARNAGTTEAPAGYEASLNADQDPAPQKRSVKQSSGYVPSSSGTDFAYASNTDVPPNVHIVVEGETLSTLAQQYLGSIDEWPKLWALNPHVTNPHWIYPGTLIYLSASAETAPRAMEAPSGATQARIDHLWMPIVLRDEGYLDPDAMKKNGYIIASKEDHMLLMLEDEVYIRFAKDVPALGSLLTVYRKINKWERMEGEKGQLVRILGTVKLLRYDSKSKLGTGVLRETFEPIERGYSLAPIVRRIPVVKPKPNAKTLKVKVIAAIQPRKLLATYQLVFINVGREQGVEQGNRVEFTTKGDPWRDGLKGMKHGVGDLVPVPKQPDKYPTEVVSEGYVVDVQTKTATVLITHATRTIEFGNPGRMLAGK